MSKERSIFILGCSKRYGYFNSCGFEATNKGYRSRVDLTTLKKQKGDYDLLPSCLLLSAANSESQKKGQ
jgi:hypothetical protein